MLEQVRPKGHVIGLQRRSVHVAATMVSAVIVCDCGSPAPVLIPNHDRAGICLACKTKYVISELVLKNTGLVSVETQVAKWNGPMSASRELDVQPAGAG